MGALLASAPFAFLAWLPSLLHEPWLAVVTLPLGLAGAAAIYAIMVAGGARLLSRREPAGLGRGLGGGGGWGGGSRPSRWGGWGPSGGRRPRRWAPPATGGSAWT